MKKFLLTMAAAALAVSGAWAEVTTFDFVTKDYGMDRGQSGYEATPLTMKEGNITLTGNNTSGNGFRLWNDGLRIYKTGDGEATIKVEAPSNETITAIDVKVKNKFTSIKVGNVDLNYANNTYSWTGNSTEPITLVISQTSGNYAIQTLTVTTEAGASDKEPAGLKFSAAAVSVVQGEAFEAPALVNPNNLPVSWTSSDENVATVDNAGKVTIVGGGTTTITAAFEGNDKYAAGNAHYTLTVIGKANSLNELFALCTAKDDKAIVTFPLTVVYVNDRSIYVIDAEGTATLLFNNNSYEKGNIIPAGWTATYSPFNTLPEFVMSETPASTTNAEVTYPEVSSVGKADVNRVVVLKGVTFSEATPEAKSNFNGTLADGSTLAFRNNFLAASVEAGTYDVTCAVALYNNNLQVYPIAYNEPVKEPVAPEQITGTSANGTATWGKVQGYPGLVFDLKTDKATVAVKFDIPEGFTNWFIYDEEAEGGEGGIEPLTRAEAADWSSLSELQSYIPWGVVASEITLKTDKTPYYLTLYPVWGDMVDAGNMFFAQINIDFSSGVEAIEAAEASAEYYNLQGVRVLNPENGMYIKVVNGKSTKVIVK